MSNDTVPETPIAKASEPRIKLSDRGWRSPADSGVEPSGRLDLQIGLGGVRTLKVAGPFAALVGVGVLLVVAAIFMLMFVFAVGAGVALLAGAAILAPFAMLAAKLARPKGPPRPVLDGAPGRPVQSGRVASGEAQLNPAPPKTRGRSR